MDQAKQLKITAHHEAGHFIYNAVALGKRVKTTQIALFSEEEGFTDYFLPDEPTASSQNIFVGAGHKLPERSKEPVNWSWEEYFLMAHRDRPLEEYLASFAAGVEASIIYAERQGWDTTQLNVEAENPESQDRRMMQLLINGNDRQDEGQELIRDARRRARTLLLQDDIWEAVHCFALLLIEKKELKWTSTSPEDSIPENYKQIINDLIAKGTQWNSSNP